MTGLDRSTLYGVSY